MSLAKRNGARSARLRVEPRMSRIDTSTHLTVAEMPVPNFRGSPGTLDGLTRLGRVQLSRHFFMRDFLYSEIGAHHRLPNVPHDPNLAIRSGRLLAETLLEPLVETFGPIVVRSAYRSPEVNGFGAEHGLGCASNERNRASHIWDLRDAAGRMGATVSVVIPWFARGYDAGRDWRDLAWWMHDHLPPHGCYFFPVRAAFNIGLRDRDQRNAIGSYIAPKGKLLVAGETPSETRADRAARYIDFPPYRGIEYPI